MIIIITLSCQKLKVLVIFIHSLILVLFFLVLKSEVDDMKSTLTSAESQLQVLKKEKNETNIEALRKYAALESKVIYFLYLSIFLPNRVSVFVYLVLG